MPQAITQAMIDAAQEQALAEQRIAEARKRLAAATRKYNDYQRRNPVAP